MIQKETCGFCLVFNSLRYKRPLISERFGMGRATLSSLSLRTLSGDIIVVVPHPLSWREIAYR